MAARTNSKIRKVHIFGVDFREKHLFGIASIVVIEKPKFYIYGTGTYQGIGNVVMLVVPIDRVGYNSKRYQIMFSKYFR